METEALKAFAFNAACKLLHLNLIENRESIVLLPRFADHPLDLHLAVLQALLALVNRVQTLERPYLLDLAQLLLDLLAALQAAHRTELAPFTQQTVLAELLQAVLAPVAQQRQDERSARLRGALYLPLLRFLTDAVHAGAADILEQPLQAALPLLLPALAEDIVLPDLSGRSAALGLLNLLLRSSLGKEALTLLLEQPTTLHVGLQRGAQHRICCA